MLAMKCWTSTMRWNCHMLTCHFVVKSELFSCSYWSCCKESNLGKPFIQIFNENVIHLQVWVALQNIMQHGVKIILRSLSVICGMLSYTNSDKMLRFLPQKEKTRATWQNGKSTRMTKRAFNDTTLHGKPRARSFKVRNLVHDWCKIMHHGFISHQVVIYTN